jgi:hypothetical protein
MRSMISQSAARVASAPWSSGKSANHTWRLLRSNTVTIAERL